MSVQRNPAYDKPDAHELGIMRHVVALGLHVRLLPSTRVQRRARAAYGVACVLPGWLPPRPRPGFATPDPQP